MKVLPLLVFAIILFDNGLSPAAFASEAVKPTEAKPPPSPAAPVKSPASKTYLLRTADVISVDVVDDARANHEYKLTADGTVKPVYLSQSIKLAGLSAAAAEDALGKAYVDAGVFAKPQITVTVKEYTERRIYFVGEVNHPGAVVIPPEQELSLVAAFSLAGGHNQNASRYCTITRLLPDGKSTTIKMDLRGAVEDAKKDIMLQEGDAVLLGQSALGGDWH